MTTITPGVTPVYAWRRWEILSVAARLGRVLVEPCVRNGCLEPCRYGLVESLDSDAAARRGRDPLDPLDLPYIPFACEGHWGNQVRPPCVSKPLRC